MAEYNIALLNQMKMNKTLNFSDFASIRFVDNQQQARMMDDCCYSVFLAQTVIRHTGAHDKTQKKYYASCSLSSFTNRRYSPFSSSSLYNFRIQNLFLYFCSRLDVFVAVKQLAVDQSYFWQEEIYKI